MLSTGKGEVHHGFFVRRSEEPILGLSSMQGRYEHDLVVVLQDVIAFSFQLPICVVDQDENARSPGVYG